MQRSELVVACSSVVVCLCVLPRFFPSWILYILHTEWGEVKNRKPQATYSKGNFENDKKPNYNVQQTTEFGSRRPTSNKINNSINSNSKVNNSFSKPVFNQSVNTNKKPQNIKPTYSKPSYNKPVYSKPSKTKKPFEDNSIKTPSSDWLKEIICQKGSYWMNISLLSEKSISSKLHDSNHLSIFLCPVSI